MSVLDPIWFGWQRRIGQRTFDKVASMAGVPSLTSEIPFVPELGPDKSPIHHIAWSYPSQVRRVWKSWKRRKTVGAQQREISRDVLDDAGMLWSRQLRSWLPKGSVVAVYADLGVWRLMVKVADGGPVIEGVASDQASSEQDWRAWHLGSRGVSYAATPGQAVYQALYEWALEQPFQRAVWLSNFYASLADRDVEFYEKPETWPYFGTLVEEEV